MRPSSLRWRLPLSYAAVALIATLVLGAVLLLTLQSYYHRQELDYLHRNGRTVGEQIASRLEEPALTEALQAQVKGFAFLTQRRIQIFDPTRAILLADSGDPLQADATTRLAVEVAVEGAGQQFIQSFSFETSQDQPDSTVIVQNQFVSQNVSETAVLTQTTSIEGGAADPEIVSPLQVAGTLFGFGLNTVLDGTEQATEGHSDLTAVEPIFDPMGELAGYVVVSEGPAYGQDIVASVAWGLVTAGSVAVVLAGLAGWVASQRLTRPLLSLTETTQAMAGGDLSARAAAQATERGDELGVLARAFNTMAGRVEETVTVLRRFVADAAHELQTPLTALRTDLELAARPPATGGRDTSRARAHQQIERLEKLTAGLLSLSHLEAGVGATEQEVLDLGEWVALLAEPFASRAEQQGVAFAVRRPPEAVLVRGHGQQLRLALGNLLDNGLKFTAAGGLVAVEVAVEGAWAAVVVSDTGIGIPAEDRPYLFDRFHRGRNAAAYPGSGLGLAIARTIVEQHGGRIEFSNTEAGSRFIVWLPVDSI